MKSYSAEQQHKRMTTESMAKLVLSMSVPTVISQIMNVIYNTADTWFVSRIGTSASAAVGVAFSIMSIIQAMGYGICMGTGSLISLYLGEKRNDDAKTIASSGFFASLVLGIFVGATGLAFLEPLMRLLGSTETMLPYACSYAKYIFLGAPVMCMSFLLNAILRAEGESGLAMISNIIGGLVNVFLDPILIFVFNMGTGGAALATILSQLVSLIIMAVSFVTGKSIVNISLFAVSNNLKIYSNIVMTGIPTICRQSLGSVAFALLNRRASIYGDAVVAAITIANKIYVFVRSVTLGIGQGFQPVAGYNFGAGEKKRTGRAFIWACVFGSVICVSASFIIGAFPDRIIEWFRDDPAVISVGADCLRYLCFSMPVLAYSTFVNQLYQSLGFKGKASFLASCRQGIFFIPALYILQHFLGVKGLLMTQSVADILTCIISVPFQIWFFRNIIGRDKNVSTACGQTSSENS